MRMVFAGVVSDRGAAGGSTIAAIAAAATAVIPGVALACKDVSTDASLTCGETSSTIAVLVGGNPVGVFDGVNVGRGVYVIDGVNVSVGVAVGARVGGRRVGLAGLGTSVFATTPGGCVAAWASCGGAAIVG